MKRNVPFVLTCLTIAAVMLLATASAQAGGKDKRSFKMKSKSSNGPSASRFGSNKSAFSATRKKQNFNPSGNSSGNNRLQSMKRFNTKKLNPSVVGGLSNKHLSTFNQFQNPGGPPSDLKRFNKEMSNRAITSNLNSALLKRGNLNGLPNNVAGPNRIPQDLADIGRKNIADQIRNPNLGDLFADKGAGPGNGGPESGGPGNDGNHHDHDDHHGHHGYHNNHCHFPWWPPIIIGGGHHNHCFPGTSYGGDYYPPVNNITVVEQPITTVAPAVQPFIDLELLDVRFVDAGDPAHNLGLRYRITFRNRGTLPVGNFQVMVITSTDGTPQPGAPSATAEIVALAADEVLSVDVRLPVSADIATMNALIVALDSAVQIAELDEQNNVAVLDRAKIAAADLASIGTP